MVLEITIAALFGVGSVLGFFFVHQNDIYPIVNVQNACT